MNKWFLVMVIIIFLAVPATSMNWDNTLKYKDNKITITDNLGLGGTLVEVEKVYNTNYCFSECYTIWDVTIYQDEDDFLSLLEFKDVKNKNRNLDHKFEYVSGYTKSGEEVWSDFNVEGKLPVGDYTIKLTGYKDWEESIDWIPTFYGQKVSQWAWWHTPSPHMYFKFDEVINGSNPIDSTGNFTGVNYNSVNYTTGKLYNAGWFEGIESISSRITTSYGANLTIGSNFTVAVWFKSKEPAPYAVNDGNIIWASGTGSGAAGILSLFVNDSGGVTSQWRSDSLVGGACADNYFRTYSDGTLNITDDAWHRIVLTKDGSKDTDSLLMYVDGSLIDSADCPNECSFLYVEGESNFTIGAYSVGTYSLNQTKLDDFQIYLDTWSAVDVTHDYAGGVGLPADTSTIDIAINLDIPADNLVSSSSYLNFSGRNSVINGNFTNTTLYVWNPDGSLFDINTSIITGTTNTTNLTMGGFSFVGTYNWNIYSCAINDTSSLCDYVAANRTILWGLTTDVTYSNLEVSETANQNLHINVTSGIPISSANLIYNGTPYSATVTNITGMSYKISRDLITPPVGHNFVNDSNRNLYWNINFDSGVINTSTYYQNVSFIYLGLCNATWNIPYLNFTFKDESSSAIINGTIDASTWFYYLSSASVNKTFTYSTTANYTNYTWCFTPSSISVKTVVDQLQYSLPGYPQRRYELTETTLSSATLDKTLYLLAAGSGIYSTYSVQTSAGVAIENVKVTVERQIGANWVLVESGYTDTAGAVTFWLNPDYDHRITATKTGYTSFQGTIRPSSSSYTITLGTGVGDAEYTSDLEGIKWVHAPASGRLVANQSYNFQFNITSSKGNIIGCKMELTNMSDYVLNSTIIGCGSGGGNLSFWRNMTDGTRFYGKYYVDIGDGYITLDADAYWILLDVDAIIGTLKDFWENIIDIPEWSNDEMKREFSRIMWVFLIGIVLLGVLCSTTGWDFSTQGGALLLLFPIVLFISIGGFFTMNIGPNEFWNKYAVATISAFITLGWLFNWLATRG